MPYLFTHQLNASIFIVEVAHNDLVDGALNVSQLLKPAALFGTPKKDFVHMVRQHYYALDGVPIECPSDDPNCDIEWNDSYTRLPVPETFGWAPQDFGVNDWSEFSNPIVKDFVTSLEVRFKSCPSPPPIGAQRAPIVGGG